MHMDKKNNIFRRMGDYLRDIRGEMKKVTWPSRNDLIKTSIAVLVISLFFGVYLFGVDMIFARIFQNIGGIFR